MTQKYGYASPRGFRRAARRVRGKAFVRRVIVLQAIYDAVRLHESRQLNARRGLQIARRVEKALKTAERLA